MVLHEFSFLWRQLPTRTLGEIREHPCQEFQYLLVQERSVGISLLGGMQIDTDGICHSFNDSFFESDAVKKISGFALRKKDTIEIKSDSMLRGVLAHHK